MKQVNCIMLALLMLSLLGCAPRSPGPPPLYAMSVREMFPDDSKAQALALAAADGDIKRMDKLVARGADVNAQGTNGVTVPAWVIHHPNKEGFKRLMELGADPNIHWKSGRTLLHWITFMTDEIGIEYLQMALEIGGGDPNVPRADSGQRPIRNTFYLRENRLKAFALLYNAGAEIDYKDKLDAPLVDYAALSNDFDLAYFMLEEGVDFHTTNKSGGIHATIRSFCRIEGDGTVTCPSNMWFWRCVDFLEKKGMTFDFLPKDKRPAVLDTSPPPILLKLNKR